LLEVASVDKPMTLAMPMVKIRLKCPDVDSFVGKYHADVNPAGLFVRTRSPLAAGTRVSFDVRLSDDSCLFRGSGVVVWARADDTLAPLLDAGMMLGFEELRDGTRDNFERVLAGKRAMEAAADTVPTLVRTFAGDPQPLPMTTKMAADEVEALRSRMRAQMAADGEAPATPVELGVQTAAPGAPALLPTMVPSQPRLAVEATPLPSAPAAAPLAKILVLRPQAASPADGAATVDPHDLTPLPPVARVADLIEDAPLAPGEVTALVDAPGAASQATRLLAIAIFGWTLLTLFALIRLNVVQRMLEWLSGA
jgi:uncharacterized protein (TIGR02266 family)